MKWYHLLLVCCLFINCKTSTKETEYKILDNKTEPLTAEGLTDFEHYVIREQGTERAFTGAYWNHFEKGVYVCKVCNQVLFTSDAKFDSDCGWPSFDQAIKGTVVYTKDSSLNMDRIEVSCSKCKGHLGHVFDDGPTQTTGKRYCTNSVSIKFIPEDEIQN
nr:peptide-methionine (R)-S-oxide reductase MsrB [uncultured Flavobacterium sp.]